MLKIADKTSNLRALAMSPPVGWDLERRHEYINWAEAVVAGCRGLNAKARRRLRRCGPPCAGGNREHGITEGSQPAKISRAAYADMFGPTTGDKVRLADTELFIEVEKDFTTYGEEVKFGGGKVIRDGMGQSQVTRADGAVDTVITNALIIDPSPASSRPMSG